MNSAATSRLSPASLALREAVAEDPDKVALEIDEQRVSYGELNEQVDRLAHRLVTDLGQADQRVALRASGTHALSVGFLAIQRAGMVAVGLDPTAPMDRVRDILDDVEPSIVLTDVAGDVEAGLAYQVTDVWEFGSQADPVPVDRERGELASIVYTSGSTGRPKGIMMGRTQMLALLSQQGEWQLPARGRLGILAAGTVAHSELGPSIAMVLRGTFVAYEIRRHGLGPIGGWLQRSELDSCHLVPTVLRHVLPTLAPGTRLDSIRRVILSGETATWDDVTRLRRVLGPEAVIVNAFGQSETATIATMVIRSDSPTDSGPLPAGQPIPEISVAIIGAHGHPVPTGEPGEIVVRGRQVSLGYWRRPELNRATYTELGDGVRELRTGDGGRLLADGTLEHLGRLDHLVKISGNRVELGEVEAALLALDGVGAAAAAAFSPDGENTRLAACVVPLAGAALDPRVLRVHLARRLPGYMVPTRIAVAESLPQLPGGKVDRAAVATLPTLQYAAHEDVSSPDGSVECELAAIWRKLLSLEHVSRDEDFFALGGDSMRAARMFIEIERRLGIDRPVSLLAEAPTIAALATVLRDPDPAWAAPLALQTQGSRPPLFVIHDGMGTVLYARGLAGPLGSDQPIYAIRCEALSGQAPQERSLTQLASRYVEQIRMLHPAGPYVFYGVSLGGVLALEMARQLLEEGADVPLVVMGDSFVFGSDVNPEDGELAYRRRTIARLRPMDRCRYLCAVVAEKLAWYLGADDRATRRENRRLEQALRRGAAIPISARGVWAMRELGKISLTHQVRPPYPAHTVLLRGRGPGRVTEHGLREFLGDSLQITDVPLSHRDFGREASGGRVGPAIRSELDRVAAATRPEAPVVVPA
jgi:amino acid adenylation domain-containing protein